tara:strand:- start:90 stop:218 length:129 start_codon:yes stop_codon:yes gene_type:complete
MNKVLGGKHLFWVWETDQIKRIKFDLIQSWEKSFSIGIKIEA